MQSTSKRLHYWLLLLMLISSVAPFSAPRPLQAGIYNSSSEVTYKEYWIPHTEYTGGCTNPIENSWYLEPWPGCVKTLRFQLPDDFSQALKIEIYLDLWRNRTRQTGRFRLNEGTTIYAPPVGAEWSRTPYVMEIPKSELRQGENTISLFESRGGWHVHDIAFRIYHDAEHPLIPGPGSDVTPPTGRLTAIMANNRTFTPRQGGVLKVDNNQVTLTAEASGAAYVEFHAYYQGYDEDNDGQTLDWHNANRNNFNPGGVKAKPTGGTMDHIGTDAVAPYQVTWNLAHIVSQTGVKFKLRLVDEVGNVREAAGAVSAEFRLRRTYPVEAYTIPNFVDAVLNGGGAYPKRVTRTINLPSDLGNVSAAYIIGAYWNNPFLSINGKPTFTAFDKGSYYGYWDLSIRPVPVEYLKPGVNQIEYSYNSKGGSWGHFVEKPGPMIILVRNPNGVAAECCEPTEVADTVGVVAGIGGAQPVEDDEYLPLSVDTGVVAVGATGMVWVDGNRNGQKEGDEATVANAQLTLSGVTEWNDPYSATVHSGVDGAYLFANVPPGNYTLTLTLSPTYSAEGATSAPIVINETGGAEVMFPVQQTEGANHQYFLPLVKR